MCACSVNTDNREQSELMHRWIEVVGLFSFSSSPSSLTVFSLMEKMIGLIIHGDRHPKIKLHQILLVLQQETIWAKAIPICDHNLTSDQTQSQCFELSLVIKIKQDSILNRFLVPLAPLVTQMVKNLPAVQETRFRSLSWEDSLEKRMATHASILAWRIPWTEEPGGYCPWDHKELDTIQQH